jgi:hypothetical protein
MAKHKKPTKPKRSGISAVTQLGLIQFHGAPTDKHEESLQHMPNADYAAEAKRDRKCVLTALYVLIPFLDDELISVLRQIGDRHLTPPREMPVSEIYDLVGPFMRLKSVEKEEAT